MAKGRCSLILPELGLVLKINSQLDVQITCIDCFVSGELIYRGHFDQDFTNGDDIDIHLQWAWVEVEVTKAIKSQLKLEFYLALESKEWEISLLPAPISFSPFQVRDFLLTED